MPVGVTSRYWRMPNFEVGGTEDEPGSTAIARRPVAPSASGAPITHMMTGTENIEYLAWRFYGRSNAWWHIADANDLAFPLDYRAGRTIDVPTSNAVGRVVRTRGF